MPAEVGTVRDPGVHGSSLGRCLDAVQPLATHEAIAQCEPDPCASPPLHVSQQSLRAGGLRGAEVLPCSQARSLTQAGFEHRTLLSRRAQGHLSCSGTSPVWAQLRSRWGLVGMDPG